MQAGETLATVESNESLQTYAVTSPIAGVISQRGAVLPVLDLRLARGRPATPPDRATRLVVVRHAAIDLALLVDAVHDLLPASAAAPPLVDLGALIAAAQSHS